MIEALAAAALRCPRPVVEQDLTVVWVTLALIVGAILGGLTVHLQRRIDARS